MSYNLKKRQFQKEFIKKEQGKKKDCCTEKLTWLVFLF